MASYRQTAEGNWQCQIRKKGYKPVSATFDKKSDAQAWAAKIEGQMVSGKWRDRDESDNTTLGEALQRYLDEVSVLKKGHANERYRILAWMADPIAKKPLSAVRSQDIAEWRNRRLKKVTSGTVRNDLAVLSHLFTIARKEWGFSLDDPFEKIQLPAMNAARTRRAEGDELDRLIDAAKGSFFRVLEAGGDGKKKKKTLPVSVGHLIVWASETAMRAGEMALMTWGMIDLGERFADLPGEITKTGEPRSFYFSNRAAEVLLSLPLGKKGDYVFCGITSNAITQAFINVRDKAGISGLRLHDLRREATSSLFEKDLTIHEVQQITGHKTLSMLQRYTHLRPSQKTRDKLG